MKPVLFLKADVAPPSEGATVEFNSDTFTDRGPATGIVKGSKITVDGVYITLAFADQQESFSWDDLRDHCRKRPDGSYLVKSHPAVQGMTRSLKPGAENPDDIAAAARSPALPMIVRRNPGEPSREQAESGKYNKPRVEWQGLTIAIENPAGSIRRGTNRAGGTWEVRMLYAYGEILGSMGVDGDPVDVFLGPNLEAPLVYVVHQRAYGNWDKFDEDKCMVGFDSEADATAAFLACYSDPRFLGPITAMPVEEFKTKVRATKDKPAMIKALFFRPLPAS